MVARVQLKQFIKVSIVGSTQSQTHRHTNHSIPVVHAYTHEITRVTYLHAAHNYVEETHDSYSYKYKSVIKRRSQKVHSESML